MGTYKRLPRGRKKPAGDFVSFAEKTYIWTLENWRILAASFLVVFFIFGSGLGIYKYYKWRSDEAAKMFVSALEVKDDQERHKALEEIVEKYRNTVSAREALLFLGAKAMVDGNIRAAIKWYDELNDQSRSYPVFKVYALHNLGRAYSMLREWTNAAMSFEKASNVKGNLIKEESIYMQAQSLEKAGDYVVARKLYTSLLEGKPEPDLITKAKSEERLLWLAAQGHDATEE